MPDTIIRVQIEDDGPDDDTKLDRAAPAPPAAASPAAPPPWYDEYRGLRNRADLLGEAGKKLGDKDTARLDALQKKIEEMSGAAAPPPPPPAPPPQPAADRTPAPPARDDLAAMREFLLTSKDPGLRAMGFTRQTAEGMSPDMVRQLAEGAGYKPPEPPAPTAMKWDAATDAATDAMDRLRKGLLTTEEALERVAKAARKGGDGLTDSLRAAGVIGKDQTAAEYYRGKVEDAAERAGKLPVGERRATVVSARDPLPVAKPITDARARMLDEQAEAREAAAERAEAMGRRARTRQMAEGVRGMAGANSASGFAGSAMQLAESGALGGRAAAMAGGPAGMAVVAALAVRDAVNGLIKKPFETAREGIGTAGAAARDVAGGQGAALLDRGATAAGNALSKLGPYGIVAGEALKTFGTGVREAAATVAAFVARGREISQYDGRLAGAAAAADVAGLMRDIKEAKVLGGKYADLISAQSNAQGQLAEVLLPVKEFFLERLTRLTDLAAAAIRGVGDLKPLLEQIETAVRTFAKIATLGQSEALLKEMVKLAEAEKEGRAIKERLDGLKWWSEQFDPLQQEVDKLQLGPAGPVPDQAALDRKLMMPILGGG